MTDDDRVLLHHSNVSRSLGGTQFSNFNGERNSQTFVKNTAAHGTNSEAESRLQPAFGEGVRGHIRG